MFDVTHWVKVYQQDKLLWEGPVNGTLENNHLNINSNVLDETLQKILKTCPNPRLEIENAWEVLDTKLLEGENEINEHGSA